MRGSVYLACVLAVCSWSAAAEAADKPANEPAPAVDGINTKIDVLAGSISNSPLYATSGLLALPLAPSYGLEVVGAGGTLDSRGFGAGGVNLFWRDPARGRLGIMADYLNLNTQIGGIDAYRLGGEAEHYFGRFTLRGEAGAIAHSGLSTASGATAVHSGSTFFERAALDYYVVDNVKFSVGHSYSNNKHAATLGAEWGFAVGDRTSMAALFADASFASGNTTVMGGLRLYTGRSDKTLIRRNREDDATLIQFLAAATVVGDLIYLAIQPLKH